MKNINSNESTSFESSLGSPLKPLQSYEGQKPKQIFFVNQIDDTSQPLINTIIDLGPPPKNQPQHQDKKNQKKKIKFEFAVKSPKNKNNNKPQHTLNFDALFHYSFDHIQIILILLYFLIYHLFLLMLY